MATVRKLLDNLTQGKTTLEKVAAELRGRSWVPPETTDVTGTVDAPLPPADSPDWIDIHGRLTNYQRRVLRQAYGADRTG